MPSELPHDDDANVGDEYIQYRGPGGNVVAEPTGTNARIPFNTVQMLGASYQKPYPVVDDDEDDPPTDAILRSIADTLVDTNALICWGVACPQDGCGEAFDGPDGLKSHYRQKHSDDEQPDTQPADDDDDGDGAGDGDD